jgi:pimeloyl-ACP methyl ester carboxylesterase
MKTFRDHHRGPLRQILPLVLLSCLPGVLCADQTPADGIRRQFVDSRFGQLHLRKVVPSGEVEMRTPLVLFHSSPLSSVIYEDLARAMGTDRVVMAMDTPGFGDSERPPAPQPMAELAGAMADALLELGYGRNRRVDLFGRATGATLAIELAAQRPDLVRRLAVATVAFVSGEQQQAMYQEYVVGNNVPVPEDGSHLADYWKNIVTDRAVDIEMDAATDIFAALIRAKDVQWWGYHAVFTHDTRAAAVKLKVPVVLIDYPNTFQEAGREFLSLVAEGASVSLPDYSRNPSPAGALALAAALRRGLDGPASLTQAN